MQVRDPGYLELHLFPFWSSWRTAGAFPYRIRLKLDDASMKAWLEKLSKGQATRSPA